MADQLRADYLGCFGHPTIRTPNIDRLAKRGLRFESAYVQAPVCGGSRMSFYTGRYAFSHGAHYNGTPLRVDEWTLGDYLRPLGYRVALTGKTHMRADSATLDRLGIDAGSPADTLTRQCGFEPFERDDGLHPDASADPDLAYNRWLRARGYPGPNPWHSHANSAEGPRGETLSGWHLRHSHHPARVRAEHSETAYMTDRALDFLAESGDRPWCLHLSYIKPHWPYMAPAPYHALYRDDPIPAANRHDRERIDPNPVRAAFMDHEESVSFSRDLVRERVIPTYMGLISEIDHHLGRLLDRLDALGLTGNTVVVFTSDHGDYLGDHWLGEKDLFHEEIVRVPLIVADPRPNADPSRGRADSRLVEAIDLAPTFLEMAGGAAQPHRLEGRSLGPLLRAETNPEWRDAVYADGSFAERPARLALGLEPHEARAFMVRTRRWKLVRFERHPPWLFDLENDPGELNDLGACNGHEAVRQALEHRLFDWLRTRRLRVTLADDVVRARTGDARGHGFLFGVW
jgi:arylsulfatase A-like enzyme